MRWARPRAERRGTDRLTSEVLQPKKLVRTAAGRPGLGRGHETLPPRCGRPAAALPALLADMARNPSAHVLVRQGTTLISSLGLANEPQKFIFIFISS